MYVLGVAVAVMLELLMGALTARSAEAETLVVDNSTDEPFRPQPHCTDAPNNCTLRARR